MPLKYFPHILPRQMERFAMLQPLYREWNERINVVSRRDIDALYEHHVLHSLAIARVVAFAEGAEVLDAGTGGGFPGIPLAILFPGTHFHLVDAVGKKIKVVNAVLKALQLENVSTQHIRAEQVNARYDFVVSRAVTSVNAFLPWIRGKFLQRRLHPLANGTLFLKGGDLTEELERYRETAVVFPIREMFSEPFFEEKKVIYIPAGLQ
ncbi:MAG: 16S rRNA (guanine(527)-N(7))-methyltransferase RsmG [Bacteroidales bacterium]|jgi:16S rRNA (guanine527-N7)-methyltransferase|nr:16S rRNA (guanine(527)-N(7))-methyltransferase RsmG [Bacteroidales bacterium]